MILFAILAVTLAAVGVYSVMAYTVSQRIPEIGVRIALGASPNRVVGMLLWQGGRLALAGLGLGLVAAVFAGRAAESLLFRVHGLDPLTFSVAPAVVVIAALAATYLRRAGRPASPPCGDEPPGAVESGHTQDIGAARGGSEPTPGTGRRTTEL